MKFIWISRAVSFLFALVTGIGDYLRSVSLDIYTVGLMQQNAGKKLRRYIFEYALTSDRT